MQDPFSEQDTLYTSIQAWELDDKPVWSQTADVIRKSDKLVMCALLLLTILDNQPTNDQQDGMGDIEHGVPPEQG